MFDGEIRILMAPAHYGSRQDHSAAERGILMAPLEMKILMAPAERGILMAPAEIKILMPLSPLQPDAVCFD